MILLLGGTSETAPLAESIAAAGFEVLVSTASDVPLEVGNHPRIFHRFGPLDVEGMAQLANERGIKAIVDASHPYASAVHAHAKKTADTLSIPYLSWSRPSWSSNETFVSFAQDHDEAARIAFSFSKLFCSPRAPGILGRTRLNQLGRESRWWRESWIIRTRFGPARKQKFPPRK